MKANSEKIECLETDVLVIGSGIAGGVAALELADAGVSVTLVTRAKKPTESNTYYAQGGIVYEGIDDSPESLAEDVIRAGAGHSNPRAVIVLAERGPELVREILLEKLNIVFDRTPDGEFSLVREGGHSIPRILHASDASGKSIEVNLINVLASHENVTLLTSHTAIDLLTPSHHSLNTKSIYDPESCLGAYLLDQEGERVIRCLAKKTIVATGGLGQIFLRTTNPLGARGDGLAMAYRAGARVINNEFVQFHPTTFYHQHAPSFLISEAVRGAGARLVDVNGEPFMQKYNEEWKDLAPRDIVARSILQEMLNHNLPNVYLDLKSYIPTDKIREEFPNIYESCLAYDIDITSDLVPIVPAAHYACGGIWVDDWGKTTIANLYAVGEVSCTGVHGANRLASTSLLEGLVWGHQAAKEIQSNLKDVPAPDSANIPSWQDAGLESPDPALILQDMSSIRHIMWNYVGLMRTNPRLERAIHDLRNLETEIEHFYRVTRLTDGLIGLRNAVRVATIVTLAAWENKVSVGCHYRE